MSEVIFQRLLVMVERHGLLLILMVALLRLSFVLSSDLDLIGDESYYWDWSRQPDWCYYSKPPMVAWLIHLSTSLLGHVTWAVRLPTLFLGTLGLVLFQATARAFYGSSAAALALLMLLATPVNVLANFLMTIDPPLYCFWIMSVYFMQRALFEHRVLDWWWAGCASALALLSKQAALVLPLSLLLFLVLDAQYRDCLKKQFLWYLTPIVLAALPILFWNQQHDWVMFGHSQSHFSTHQSPGLSKHLQQAGEFIAYQALLISPLLLALVIIESVRGLLGFRALESRQRFLWLMGPLAVLSTLLLSLLQKAQGNWSMPFYFTALLFLVGQWQRGRWRRTLRHALLIGYVMVGLTYALPLVIRALDLQNSALDPTRRFKHWQAFAVDVQQHRLQALPPMQGGFVVALGHRYLASQLAFYLPDHPKVFRYEASGRVTSQYEVWPGPFEFVGQNALIVSSGNAQSVPIALRSAFEVFETLGPVANPDKPQSPYTLYLGRHLKQWPSPFNPKISGTVNAASEN